MQYGHHTIVLFLCWPVSTNALPQSSVPLADSSQLQKRGEPGVSRSPECGTKAVFSSGPIGLENYSFGQETGGYQCTQLQSFSERSIGFQTKFFWDSIDESILHGHVRVKQLIGVAHPFIARLPTQWKFLTSGDPIAVVGFQMVLSKEVRSKTLIDINVILYTSGLTSQLPRGALKGTFSFDKLQYELWYDERRDSDKAIYPVWTFIAMEQSPGQMFEGDLALFINHIKSTAGFPLDTNYLTFVSGFIWTYKAKEEASVTTESYHVEVDVLAGPGLGAGFSEFSKGSGYAGLSSGAVYPSETALSGGDRNDGTKWVDKSALSEETVWPAGTPGLSGGSGLVNPESSPLHRTRPNEGTSLQELPNGGASPAGLTEIA